MLWVQCLGSFSESSLAHFENTRIFQNPSVMVAYLTGPAGPESPETAGSILLQDLQVSALLTDQATHYLSIRLFVNTYIHICIKKGIKG